MEDLAVEQLTGQPHLEVEVNRQAIARYGINTSQVMDVVRAAVGGTVIGQVFEGHQRFDIFIRFLPEFRQDPVSISNILISSPDGQRIPLSRLASVREVIAPREINRENNLRRIIVQCNVRGRDIGSWVKEAQRKVKEEVKLPPGYFITWGGEFENQQRAMRRLALIIPLSVILIFILLATTFRSLRYALLIILAIPFAFIGGILALFLSGQYLSVPASIGFIVLFGTAVLDGVVMVSHINRERQRCSDLEQAVLRGAMTKLRPVVMTTLTTVLRVTPLLFSLGTGAELQRPLATVVVGGAVTAILLTLFMLPTLYSLLERKKYQK